MKKQFNSIGNDIKFLRGKSVIQLLEIRKWRVQKDTAEQNVKSIYVKLKTKEKGTNEIINLMNLDQFDDKVGKVNEFLYEGKTCQFMDQLDQVRVLQPRKLKSIFGNFITVIKKLGISYQYLFIYRYPIQQNPVFCSLGNTSPIYGFDDLQLKECQEMLQKKVFRFIFIMDRYDEMKLENLFMNNKLKQNWLDPLVIVTTRAFDLKEFGQSWGILSFLKFDVARLKSETFLMKNKQTEFYYL
ncbi:unnamed protein product [Paramecium primaurelia]|uniref:Uncharacterized protein n=1 Tax=Paramecium primaurelia TaxID=5886 RepID=A0A8S1QVT2_PARPR|nr:unnamed protein product [Paramecium primaurelia]